MTIVLPNKHYSGHRKITEKEENKRTSRKETEKNTYSKFQIQLEEDGSISI